MLRLSLLSFLLAGSAAFADGLPARNGDEVRLNVNQKSKKAVLRCTRSWRSCRKASKQKAVSRKQRLIRRRRLRIAA